VGATRHCQHGRPFLLSCSIATDEYDGTTIQYNVPDAGLTTQRLSDRALKTGAGYDYSLALHVGDVSCA
jgi:hypothetical protein